MVTQTPQTQRPPSRERLEAEQDSLTGLLNRAAAESRINQELLEASQGAMLLLDIDGFGLVNDRYGHLAGDETLRKLAYVLEKLLTGRLVARVGGDEFLAFLPEVTQESDLTQRAAQVAARLSQIGVGDSSLFLSVTVGASLCQEGDSYLSLFARTDELLLKNKRTRRGKQTAAGKNKSAQKSLMDMSLIANDLREQRLTGGAFCQSYEAFQSIFRFLERSLCRQDPEGANGKSTVVLFTLADRNGGVPRPECRERQMRLLWEEIQSGLRVNDIFVQYSSAQYLVLLYGVDEAAAGPVADRMCSSFYEKNIQDAQELVLHHCFPLKPVRRKRSREITL